MVDLVIGLQKSAMKILEETAATRLWWNKRLVIVASLIFAVGGARLVWVSAKATDGVFSKYPKWYLPSVLIALSIGLTTASCYLVVNARRDFGPVLKEESCRVQTIHIVYTSAYLTRALVYTIFVSIGIDVHSFPYLMTYYVLYNIWDVVPLMLIMTYHYKNFLFQPSDDTSSEDSDSPE